MSFNSPPRYDPGTERKRNKRRNGTRHKLISAESADDDGDEDK